MVLAELLEQEIPIILVQSDSSGAEAAEAVSSRLWGGLPQLSASLQAASCTRQALEELLKAYRASRALEMLRIARDVCCIFWDSQNVLCFLGT